MPVVAEPASDLMPRMEIALESLSKSTPGVYLARSANDFTFSMSIFAALKALTLSVTLLSDSDRRVAVTVISSIAGGALAAGAGGASAVCAAAPKARRRGTSAADAR